jgi:hypothetical protein
VRRALKDPRYSRFLADDMAPTADRLRRWQRALKVKPGKPAIWLDTKAINQVLEIFERSKEPTHYLFLGNGMYQPYLVANALFDKTPMAGHVHFIPVSRPLHLKAARGRILEPYFDQQRLATLKGNLVVVDSVSSGETLRAITQSVRRYLKKKGEPVESIRRRVIATGLIELGGRARGMVPSLKRYRSSMKRITDKDLLANKLIPSQPFVSVSWGSFFNSSYSPNLREHYWGSKYTKIDSRGFPVSKVGFTEPLSERAALSLLRVRKRKARSYLGMLVGTAKVLGSDRGLRQRVDAVAAKQGDSS